MTYIGTLFDLFSNRHVLMIYLNYLVIKLFIHNNYCLQNSKLTNY